MLPMRSLASAPTQLNVASKLDLPIFSNNYGVNKIMSCATALVAESMPQRGEICHSETNQPRVNVKATASLGSTGRVPLESNTLHPTFNPTFTPYIHLKTYLEDSKTYWAIFRNMKIWHCEKRCVT